MGCGPEFVCSVFHNCRCVRLRGALVGIDDEDDSTFTITVDNKTFHFQAKDSEERERWIRALEDTVVRHNMIARRGVGGRQGGGSVKMEDFERKLLEDYEKTQKM